MRLIIDTQILIWLLLLDKSLTKPIQELLTDADNDVFIPHICLFEIAIKQKTGKLPELTWPTNTIVKQLIRDGFELLSVATSHIATYDSIPLLPDHRDPFDRLLIATAISENIPIISADDKFRLYQPQLQLIDA